MSAAQGKRTRVEIDKFPGPYNPYPKEYNARVHGPYDPSRYYGNKVKTPFWNVKIGNLFTHIMESDYTRANMANTVTRFFSRYHERHFRVRRRPLAPMLHFVLFGAFCMSLASYGFQQETHGGIKSERRFKYH